MKIFAGSNSPRLAQAVCRELDMELSAAHVPCYPDGNIDVRIDESVRGQDCVIIQSIAQSPNRGFVELLFWVDALNRASAESVLVVIPYFSYQKGDRAYGRAASRANICTSTLQTVGVTRVLFVDLHTPQIPALFGSTVAVNELRAWPLICQAVRGIAPRHLVVVSADMGFAPKARLCAQVLGAPLAIAHKRRLDDFGRLVIEGVSGLSNHRAALLVDDFTVSGGTLVAVAEALDGVEEIYAAVSHGLFTEGCVEKLNRSRIRMLLVTDTVDHQLLPEVARMVPVALLLAETIRRLVNRQSIADLISVGAQPGSS